MADNIVQTIIVIGIAILIGAMIWGVMSGAAIDMGVSTGGESFEYLSEGDSYDLGLDARNVEVAATKEYAISLSGGGHIDATSGGDWYGDDWSLFATAWLSDDANAAATYSLVAYENETVLVTFEDGEWAAYHYVGDEAAHASIPVADVNNQTSLGVTWDNSTGELTISDGTTSDSGSLSSEIPSRTVAGDWHGTVDELRFLDGEHSDLVDTYLDDPVAPLDGDAHTARYLFDEGEGDTTRAWYADDIDVSIVDGEWVDGVPSPTLIEGEDYDISGSTFGVLDGYLDEVPVVHVSYESQLAPGLDRLVGNLGQVIALTGIVLIVLAMVLILNGADRMRRGGRL